MTKLLTIGADPEVLFAYSDGLYASVIDKMPGTKDNPYPVKDGAVQADNVTGEFNITPCTTAPEFSTRIDSVFHQLCDILSPSDLHATVDSVGEYRETELSSPSSKHSGCDPDWNAYTLQLNTPPDYTTTRLRAAGGHIHLGLDIPTADIPHFIKCLDLFITVPMVAYENPLRRSLYGRAGSFRVKDYGLEYRTPSNFWVFKDSRRRWIVEQLKRVAAEWRATDVPEKLNVMIDEHQCSQLGKVMSHFSLSPIPS